MLLPSCYYSDIGFVIAKTAADVLRIVDTYGYWGSSDSEDGRNYSFSSSTSAVRISSENLLRRHSPRSRFRQTGRASAVRDISQLFPPPAIDAVRDMRPVQHPKRTELPWDGSTDKRAFACGERTGMRSNDLLRADETRSKLAGPLLQDAVRLHDHQLLERIFERDHCRRQLPELSNHYVLCGGRLSEVLTIVSLLKTALLMKTILGPDADVLSSPACCVILTPEKPSLSQLMAILEDDASGASLLDGVFFVAGSSTRSRDLQRVGALNARRVLLLPQDAPFDDAISDDERLPSIGFQAEDESFADFAVISSLLAMEMMQHRGVDQGSSRHASHRVRSSSRFIDGSGASLVSAVEEPSSYQREIGQGLPVESVKVRALERFPDLDPSIFNKESDIIEETLKRCGSQRFDDAETDGFLHKSIHPEDTVTVLQFASNVKFCGPVGLSFEDARSPFLSPAFAAGRVFICSVFDRIVCQSFYNPYIVDVIEALAGGNTNACVGQHRCTGLEAKSDKMRSGGLSGAARDSSSTSSTARIPRQLCTVRVQEKHIGARFGAAFADLLQTEVLTLGIFRRPNPALGNALPFVYTCPCADTILHANDTLFVLR